MPVQEWTHVPRKNHRGDAERTFEKFDARTRLEYVTIGTG